MSVLVKPEVNRVLSLPPEFIIVDDGSTKQDCENKAVKRWMETIVDRYHSQHYTEVVLGDDLYSRQTICRATQKAFCNFIPGSNLRSNTGDDEPPWGYPRGGERSR